VRVTAVSLKKNVAANYVGQGWQALMGLAFVPLYVRFLGIEAYGLIGIFALLQAWLALLDMGMKPALGREMARFTAGTHTAQSIRDLLRSIELIGIGVAILVALGAWGASGWLASHWVTPGKLPVDVVAHAFAAMGVVAALRFIEDIYMSCVVGLQRQVLQNIVTGIMATARGLGAVGVLVWISPTIRAFFFWQGLISVVTVALLAGIVHRTLPAAPLPVRFSGSALIGIWRFAAGMMAITFLVLLLHQVDKILLSRLLTLESFGYYALAGLVTGGLYTLAAPITGALYPRFTQLAASGDQVALRAVYHQAAQMVTVLSGSAAMVLMVFGDRALRLWTGNPVLAQKVAPLMAVMAFGSLLNGLMVIPYQMQLAHGWTSLTIWINTVAVSLLVPAVLWAVPAYGAIGAARVWVILNAGYLIFDIPLMHRRLLPADKWRWYREDVAIPLAAAAATALICRWAMPRNLGKLGEFSVLLVTSVCVLTAAALAAPMVRDQVSRHFPRRIGPLDAQAVTNP
jgi:O-antigen/teichoic acid export membrane protein